MDAGAPGSTDNALATAESASPLAAPRAAASSLSAVKVMLPAIVEGVQRE